MVRRWDVLVCGSEGRHEVGLDWLVLYALRRGSTNFSGPLTSACIPMTGAAECDGFSHEASGHVRIQEGYESRCIMDIKIQCEDY